MLIDVRGTQAYCYTGGKPFDPALPTIVFIHGAQNDHSVWALQSRYLAHHGFGVLAVDLPGHARSSGPALTSVEAMADWLLALLDATGVQQDTMLVGHSMGSLIALEACARAPGRVSALALLATAYPMRVSDTLLDAARNAESDAIDMVNLWSHSTDAYRPARSGPGSSTVGISRRLMRKISNQQQGMPDATAIFLTDFIACNAYANGEAAARLVQCPALVLMGENDQMTPPKATAILRSAMPQHQALQIPQCGHALMSEQPDAVLDALFAFATDTLAVVRR